MEKKVKFVAKKIIFDHNLCTSKLCVIDVYAIDTHNYSILI